MRLLESPYVLKEFFSFGLGRFRLQTRHERHQCFLDTLNFPHGPGKIGLGINAAYGGTVAALGKHSLGFAELLVQALHGHVFFGRSRRRNNLQLPRREVVVSQKAGQDKIEEMRRSEAPDDLRAVRAIARFEERIEKLKPRLDREVAAACRPLRRDLDKLEKEEKDLLDRISDRSEKGRSIRSLEKRAGELEKPIRQTRAQGYAFDDEESADNVVGLAVVVPTRGVRAPILALSVTKLKSTFTDSQRAALLAELRRLAQQLGNPMATV